MPTKNKSKSFIPQGKIGLRLSIYFVLISLVFICLCILALCYIEIYQEQREKVSSIKSSINTIQDQLAKNLWDIDNDNINITLASLMQTPAVDSVILQGNLGDQYRIGTPSALAKQFKRDILYKDSPIGTLSIFYNLKEDTPYATSKFRYLLVFNILAILSMGSIFYIIVNRSIIRHISHISTSRQQYTFDGTTQFEPLLLARKHRNDELSKLVNVLNTGRKQALDLLKAKQQYQEQIEYQANYDLLTGLPNRRHLYDYLDQQIINYQIEAGHLVIMFIDLDGFKQINDSMGHGIGDNILRECAERLKKISQSLPNGYIARLGGDEFINCFYSHDYREIDSVAHTIINSFNRKIKHDDIQVKLGCSIGITIYPDHNVDDPVDIIRNADSALYKAKDSGKSTHFMFNGEMLKQISYEKKVKDKLAKVIFDDAFEVHYQPLMNIVENRIIGFEALVRWHDEELGWIRPDLFINLAEKGGMIFDIDLWVFNHAVKQVESWRTLFNEDYYISVNFSPTNFYHANFSEWANNCVTGNKASNWIELELTERLMLQNDPIVVNGIKRLTNKGIKFSLDDFGIGYSSLGHIKTFAPLLSKIKIDRLFVNEMLNENFNNAFVRSIIMLSDSLKLEVLAEGVEKTSQVNLLKTIGCQYAQGYHFYKPMTATDIDKILKQPKKTKNRL